MKQERYAFFLDIDGTLWQGGVVPDINKETIKKVRELGHKVLINTGRSYAYIPEYLYNQVDVDGVVSGIGSSVRVDGKSIFQRAMSFEDIEYIFEFFEGHDLWIIFEGEEKVIFYKHENDSKCNFSSNGIGCASSIKSKAEWDKLYQNEPIAKITVQHPDLTGEEINILKERFEIILHPSDDYMEIGTLGCDKGSGMIKAIEYFGIDRAHCVAMGDSANDLAMLRTAGISVAMGNSSDEVKQLADIVSVDCTDGGVAEAMKRILGI